MATNVLPGMLYLAFVRSFDIFIVLDHVLVLIYLYIHEYYILISQKIPSCGGNNSSTKQRKKVFQFLSSFRYILALFRSETGFLCFLNNKLKVCLFPLMFSFSTMALKTFSKIF
jgi:hypothetical protein